jgi:hypothetical protein
MEESVEGGQACIQTSIDRLRRSTSHEHNTLMEGVIIYISWEYFLGILGALIGLAYYANGRFTKLETTVDWLKETLRGLKIGSENGTLKLFEAGSPISLTETGQRILYESGIATYIDIHKTELLKRCNTRSISNPYEFQANVFGMFADLEFNEGTDEQIKRFAFHNGMSVDLIRRAGAIYFRDIIVQHRQNGA